MLDVMKLLLWLSTLRLEPAVDVAVGSILKKNSATESN